MSRPTHITINETALLNNLQRVQCYAPQAKIIAMVKANAYGHGIQLVARILADKVAAFGVACIEEALIIRSKGITTPIILMEGIFEDSELALAHHHHFEIMLHNHQQLHSLLKQALPQKIKAWIKIDTGMHRLGFAAADAAVVTEKLKQCPWIDETLGVMSHFARADELNNPMTQQQLHNFDQTIQTLPLLRQSLANSAAIIACAASHKDYVRPGIMLYGISPFADKSGIDFELEAVMSFHSKIIAIKNCKPNETVGYGGIWHATKPSVIGVVAVGYGDGYPRHLRQGTPVIVAGVRVPLVGRVSMDMITVDLTHHPGAEIGSAVELWGPHLSVEEIAHCAGTSPYELVCQVSDRVR